MCRQNKQHLHSFNGDRIDSNVERHGRVPIVDKEGSITGWKAHGHRQDHHD